MRELIPLFDAVISAIEAAAHPGAPVAVERHVADLRAAVERLHLGEAEGPDAPPLADRVAAVERAVADLHAALSDKPAPAAVQKAVAEVEVPQPDAP